MTFQMNRSFRHHHHHWLDGPWWTLTFLRTFAVSSLSRATFLQSLTSNILMGHFGKNIKFLQINFWGRRINVSFPRCVLIYHNNNFPRCVLIYHNNNFPRCVLIYHNNNFPRCVLIYHNNNLLLLCGTINLFNRNMSNVDNALCPCK